MENIIDIDAKCFDCGDSLTRANYSGFYRIILSKLGFEIQVLCNKCIEFDDTSDSEGAY